VEQGRRVAAEELVTVLAHDLRNYVAPVSGRLYALRHRAEAQDRADDVEDVNVAVRGVARLSGLIGNLLDVARLDRGLFELDIEPVDLVALAREAAATLATPEHEIVVNTSTAVVVAADPARLRQCIDNLLANAINHSPKSAPVNVLLSLAGLDGRTFGQVEVIDEGPGIPEDILPNIFERFVTGRGREGGLGLGLYLSKRIAAAHGGDLTAAQKTGKGACFLLRLPLYE
jgi:signal transduction histidine kinase